MGATGKDPKLCYCVTCDKPFHALGIMSHKAGHLRRGETCVITYTHGNTHKYTPKDGGRQS